MKILLALLSLLPATVGAAGFTFADQPWMGQFAVVAAPAAPDPVDLSGLQWKFVTTSPNTTLFTDSDMSILAIEGDEIRFWSNSVGQTRFTQTVPNAKPRYHTNTANGYGGLGMEIHASSLPWMWLTKVDGTANTNMNFVPSTVFVVVSNSSPGTAILLSSMSNNWQIGYNGSTFPMVDGTGDFLGHVSITDGNTQRRHVYVNQVETGSNRLWLNYTASSWVTHSATLLPMDELNGWGSGNNMMQGQVWAVLGYNRSLTDGEIVTVLDTLTNRYAIQVAPDLTTGLAAYWTFDNSTISGSAVTDQSGNGNTATLSGSPTTVSGHAGEAIHFVPASSQYAQAADSASLDLTGNWTISVWVNVQVQVNANISLCAKMGATSGYGLVNFGASSGVSGYWGDGSNWKDSPYSVLSAATWYHVAATYNGSRSRLYVNGVEISTPGSSRTGTVVANNDVLLMGRDFSAAVYEDLYLDEVRIYSRALSAPDIAWLATH